MKEAAQHVADEIRRKARQRLYVGVFYDPVTAVETDAEPPEPPEEASPEWDKARNAAAAKSKELLRRQARDFAAWLKRQGAI